MKSLLAAFIIVFSNASAVFAERSLTAYFLNDSVNGLRISDAYETHNMGLVYSQGNYYTKLDLGIVSPDMHIYKNRFREANRSFGEIITLEVGQSPEANDKIAGYARIKSAGHYNIDQMQELFHNIFSLQRVVADNNLVRMPDANWYGVGFRYNTTLASQLLGDGTSLSFDGYIGSDTITAQASMSKAIPRDTYTLHFDAGAKLVAFDEIISAAPIEAEARTIIPFISAGIEFNFLGYDVFVRDTFSLPTIQADDRPFGVLDAGLSFSF